MLNNFDIQIDEIPSEEYEDWLRFCANAHEASEYEKYDYFEEEEEEEEEEED